MTDLRAEAIAWLHEHRSQASLHGESSGETWAVEAGTHRVLASAQKICVLAAVAEHVETHIDFLTAPIPFIDVQSHFLAGTDAGAHERALLADGIYASGPSSGTLSVSRLLVYALHHSSNAAVDALADAVVSRTPDAEIATELPPRMSTQFIDAFRGVDGKWRHLNQPVTPAGAAAGWNTHTAPVTTLTSAAQFVARHKDHERLFKYLPRIPVYGATEVIGKLGELPGHRAGALVRRDADGDLIVGSYAFSNLPLRPQELALADAVEYVLRAAAMRTITVPFATYLPK
ncbi:hypothetical protein [Microbacterium sp. NPDC091662]|uniref:hypothetical protein n=1 Tax=Microbacterium sp. NPDC091662 TaxID=3364211 RepID=UPI003824674E